MRPTRGFTLLELMVAAAVTALLAALLLSVTSQVLGAWSRVSGQLTVTSQANIILDQIGARSVVLAGLATDICVQLTAADAFLRGLKVHVPEDCTAAELPQKKAIALAYMRDILKCDTRPWRSLRWHRA